LPLQRSASQEDNDMMRPYNLLAAK